MFRNQKRISLFIATLFAGLALETAPVFALADGQALTPPMGWSSWNWFGCTGASGNRVAGFPGNKNGIGISESITVQIADAMVSTGMKDAGYQFVNLDDCYLEHLRTNEGGLQALKKTFPKGIKAVADSVHKRGLKFGVYSCVFEYTCANVYDIQGNGQPGMWGYEQQDADTMVAWGIDYLKVDYCGYLDHQSASATPAEKAKLAKDRYTKIGTALKTAVSKARAAGKPAKDIIFSVCEWGFHEPFNWAPEIGHLWRTANDIRANWPKFMEQVTAALNLYPYSGPGKWNDTDMMEVGNNVPMNESRAHFALWSILASPMIAGNDLRSMTPEITALLTNKEITAINQDSLGFQGRKVKGTTLTTFVVSKKLKDGSFAVLFVNGTSSAATISATWAEIGSVVPSGIPAGEVMRVRDLFGKADLPNATGSFTRADIPSHDVFMFKLSGPSVGIKNKPKSISLNSIDFSMNYSAKDVKIYAKSLSPVSFSVVNLKGAIIQKSEILGTGNIEWSLPLEGIHPGTYFVTMYSGKNSLRKKLVIN